MKRSRLIFERDKAGEAPGAIMTDGEREYVVKLGIPNIHSSIKLDSYDDVSKLAKAMSVSSCEEKIFFNIADNVGDNRFITPKTSTVLLRPQEYACGTRSVRSKLAAKLSVERIMHEDDDLPINKVLKQINETPIVHFTSELIVPYENIGKFYKYHSREEVRGDMRQDEYRISSMPIEPNGIGAFFALSVFTANRDCIGNKGANAGMDTRSYKIIVVDGGLAQQRGDISPVIPSSSNGATWLDFNELSPAAQREASETFARIAMLDRTKIREIITNNEEFVTQGIFSPIEAEERINNFVKQQEKVVEVFYDAMLRNGCLTTKIMDIKAKRDLEESERKRIMELAKQAAKDSREVLASIERVPVVAKRGRELKILPLSPENTPPRNRSNNSEVTKYKGVPLTFN